MRSSSFERVRPARRVPVGPGLSPRLGRAEPHAPLAPPARLRHRRAMTRRGRVTLALLLALGFSGGWWTTRQVLGLVRGGDGGLEPPPVSSGPGVWNREKAARAPAPAPAVVEPLPPPPAPEQVLRLLPPSARDGLPAPDAPTETLRSERLGAPLVERPLEVEYTIDPELTRAVAAILRQGRVELGHVILMDPLDGRVLSYVSTAPEVFPPTRPYPMASLMKVVTAAALLESAPQAIARPCVFRGSPYTLSAALLDPPRRGRVTSFEHALAMSNNQCFAQLAVHELGALRVLDELAALGVLESPGPGHAPGEVDPVVSRLDLGQLGSGLAGSRLPPLAAARLAAALADGELVAPRWIARVSDADGTDLALPELAARRVLDPGVTRSLRRMLVETTISGTARRAFHHKGRPLLEPVRVAGKTGSLSGPDPKGHYEWFIGVAPASAPRVAVATLLVHRDRKWTSAAQVSAEVLRAMFCPGGACAASAFAAAGAEHP
ncbi:MAG: penicillin-binding transpeptidase domain-containing protein [Deltaproteobacteria bacterium]|nr:penicillin-binding transpeptidase domain-containing protein [Deltaproteobacteria bacterium]